jgi:hypothetical protein
VLFALTGVEIQEIGSNRLFPEAAEAHLPLQPQKDKEIAQIKDVTDNHNIENTGPPFEQPIHIIVPAHLNGSIKVPSEDSPEGEEVKNKTEPNTSMVEEEPHSLWKWPAGRSKFTQVRSSSARSSFDQYHSR